MDIKKIEPSIVEVLLVITIGYLSLIITNWSIKKEKQQHFTTILSFPKQKMSHTLLSEKDPRCRIVTKELPLLAHVMTEAITRKNRQQLKQEQIEVFIAFDLLPCSESSGPIFSNWQERPS